jgi:hypothetical protein
VALPGVSLFRLRLRFAEFAQPLATFVLRLQRAGKPNWNMQEFSKGIVITSQEPT